MLFLLKFLIELKFKHSFQVLISAKLNSVYHDI